MIDDNLSLTKAIQRAHGITAKDIDSYIDALEKEIASLKEQLKREQDCVDFYTSTGETVHAEGYILYGYNIEKDLEWGDDRYPKMGKLARATQARRER